MNLVKVIEDTMRDCLVKGGKSYEEWRQESRESVEAFLAYMEVRVKEETGLNPTEIALYFSNNRYIRPDKVIEYDSLFWALTGKHEGTIKRIIDEKLYHNKAHRFSFTPLHEAASLGLDNIVEYLLTKSIYVHRKDNWGLTPIMVATKRDHYKIFKILLDSKASVLDPDLDGNTILHYAAETGDKRYIFDLIQNGTCNPKLKNKYGVTALDLVRKSFDFETIQALEQYVRDRM